MNGHRLEFRSAVFMSWCHCDLGRPNWAPSIFEFLMRAKLGNLNLHDIKYRIVDIVWLIDVKYEKEESGEQRNGASERERENSILPTPLLAWAEVWGKSLHFSASDNEDFSHDLFLLLNRSSPRPQNDQKKERENVTTNRAHSCVNVVFILYIKKNQSSCLRWSSVLASVHPAEVGMMG